MAVSSHFFKAGMLALSLAVLAPVAAQASTSRLSNDPALIAEINAAYGTHFTAQPQVPASAQQ